jgi:hypothetical protein
MLVVTFATTDALASTSTISAEVITTGPGPIQNAPPGHFRFAISTGLSLHEPFP